MQGKLGRRVRERGKKKEKKRGKEKHWDNIDWRTVQQNARSQAEGWVEGVA